MASRSIVLPVANSATAGQQAIGGIATSQPGAAFEVFVERLRRWPVDGVVWVHRIDLPCPFPDGNPANMGMNRRPLQGSANRALGDGDLGRVHPIRFPSRHLIHAASLCLLMHPRSRSYVRAAA